MEDDSVRLEHVDVDCDGIKLHVVLAGPSDGEPVILLHGFPEFWYGWHRQLPALAQAGFRVIVPDQRGYNLSDKPKQPNQYTLDLLALDILHLMTELSYERFHVAGHDFGAAVAWELAEMHSENIKSLCILNVPHTRVFERAMKQGNFKQIRKSSYMLLFQIPILAEYLVRRRNFEYLATGFLGKTVPGTFTEPEIANYRDAWSQPDALTGMLNWYRGAGAGARRRGNRPEPQIEPPTLILWGEQDAFVEKVLAEQSATLCNDVDVVFFNDAGHFVQHEKPEAISNHLIRFVKAHIEN